MTDTEKRIVVASTKLALYFGYGDGGHFLRNGPWRSTLNPERDYPGFPWTIDLLDTGLLKNRGVLDRPDGRVHWTCGGTPLWIAFFWWDRSGDSRPGSDSGFYVQGFSHLEAEKAFAYACEQWPDVVARQKYPLVLQHLPEQVREPEIEAEGARCKTCDGEGWLPGTEHMGHVEKLGCYACQGTGREPEEQKGGGPCCYERRGCAVEASCCWQKRGMMFDTEEEKRFVEQLSNERRAMHDNLTATQERCTELIQENRDLKKVEQLFDIYRGLVRYLHHSPYGHVTAPFLDVKPLVRMFWRGLSGDIFCSIDSGKWTVEQFSKDSELIAKVEGCSISTLAKFVLWAHGTEGIDHGF